MKNLFTLVVRPIQADDESMMVKFHKTLSDRTVYLRYFQSLSLGRRVAHRRLAQICSPDYQNEMVLVVEYRKAAEACIVGVARLNRLNRIGEAELAVLISDEFQHQGLGTALVERLILVARDWKLARLRAEVLRDNTGMLAVLSKAGFQFSTTQGPSSTLAKLEL
jgi:acetyltransferase